MSQHGTFSVSSLRGGFERKKRFYLQDGSNPYRVLPPFGSLSVKNIMAKYWEVTWVEGSDKKKRPVVSVLKTKSNGKGKPKTILQRDPLLDKLAALQDSLTAMEQAGGQDAIVAALKEKLWNMRLDKAFYVNAISPSGEIGVLKLRYTAFQNLKTRLEELEKTGVDAINVGPQNGIVFDFKKTKDDKGKTVYPVDIMMSTYRDPNTNKLISEMQQLPIDAQVLARMDKEASDLGTLFKIVTPEEVALIATLDPKMVDRVFARPDAVETDQGPGEEEEVQEELAVGAPRTQQAPVATAAPVSVCSPSSSASTFGNSRFRNANASGTASTADSSSASFCG